MKSLRLTKNKIWLKLITYIVITAFLSQDIAWARTGISTYTNQSVENKLSANSKIIELVNEWNTISLILAIYDMYGFRKHNRITVNKIDSVEKIKRRLRNNLIKNDNLEKYREYVDRIKDVSLGEDELIYVKYLEGDSELLLRFYKGDKVDGYTVLSESEDIINRYRLQVVIDNKLKDLHEGLGGLSSTTKKHDKKGMQLSAIVRDGNREVEYWHDTDVVKRVGIYEDDGLTLIKAEDYDREGRLIRELWLIHGDGKKGKRVVSARRRVDEHEISAEKRYLRTADGTAFLVEEVKVKDHENGRIYMEYRDLKGNLLNRQEVVLASNFLRIENGKFIYRVTNYRTGKTWLECYDVTGKILGEEVKYWPGTEIIEKITIYNIPEAAYRIKEYDKEGNLVRVRDYNVDDLLIREMEPVAVESTGQKNVVSESTFQGNFLERIAEILLAALLVVVRGGIALLRRRGSGRTTMTMLMLMGLLMAPAGVALAQEGNDALLIETREFIPSEEGGLLEAIAPKRVEVYQKGGSVISRYYSSNNDLIWERETYRDGQIGAEYRDEKGNPIGIEYPDENGNLVSETLDEGKVIGAEHRDYNGNLIGIEYMDENGDLIFESYDNQDNLIDGDSDEKPGFVQEDQIALNEAIIPFSIRQLEEIKRRFEEGKRRLNTGVAKRERERLVRDSDDTSQEEGEEEIVGKDKNTSIKNIIILYLITLFSLVIGSYMFLIKRKSENKSTDNKISIYRKERNPSRRKFLKCLGVAGVLGVYEHYFGRVVHALTKEEIIPSRVEIKQDPDGYRFYINGEKSFGLPGMVYQPAPSNMHVNDFVRRYGYSGLYKALLDKKEGGQGHAKILKDIGVKAIRIYELGTDNSEDVAKVKEIFRKLKRDYDIMVMVGTYAGLYEHPNDKQAVKREVEKMVEAYCGEPWLLSWQIGNENERYLKGRDLARYVRQPINMDEKEYYNFMDELAGITKAAEYKREISHPVIFGHSDPGYNEDVVRSIMKMRNIDAVGLNAYRDSEGFDDLFMMFRKMERGTKRKLPVIISEFGKSVYRSPEQNISRQQAEQEQLGYNTGAWRTIRNNTAGRAGLGNVLGGFCFIFTDQLYRLKELPPGEWYQAYYGVVDRPSQDMFKIVGSQWVTVRGDESSEELMLKAWESLENQQFEVAINTAEIIIKRHEEQAQKEQVKKAERIKGGENFKYTPADEATKQKIQSFGSLNMVGAAYFIIGKAYKGKRQYKKAKGYFEKVIKEYPLAEVWDGGVWFWKPADAAKKELSNLEFLIPLIPLSLRRDSTDSSDTDGIGKTKAEPYSSQDTSSSNSKFDKFKNALRNLRNKMEGIVKTTLDVEVTDYNPTSPQSLILYAEPLLDNCGVIDLEKIRAMVENNILSSVVLYAEDEKNNIILEELLREVSPVVKIIKVTKSRLNERFQYNNNEADEIDALVRFAGTKGINPKDILGVIKGFSERQTEIGRLSETLKVPIVILEKTAGEAIYSFTQAVLMAITVKRAESGWFIILPPIKIITEELQREWEEYRASLQILRSA